MSRAKAEREAYEEVLELYGEETLLEVFGEKNCLSRLSIGVADDATIKQLEP